MIVCVPAQTVHANQFGSIQREILRKKRSFLGDDERSKRRCSQETRPYLNDGDVLIEDITHLEPNRTPPRCGDCHASPMFMDTHSAGNDPIPVVDEPGEQSYRLHPEAASMLQRPHDVVFHPLARDLMRTVWYVLLIVWW